MMRIEIELTADAIVSLDRLKRYRSGAQMASVWEPIDGYPPDEQRADDRRVLCNAVVTSVLEEEMREAVAIAKAE
jgi:hypothetical protein